MKLNETQVQKLLGEGYSYEDITMFEQAVAAKAAAKGVPTKSLTNIAKSAVTVPKKAKALAKGASKAVSKIPGVKSFSLNNEQDEPENKLGQIAGAAAGLVPGAGMAAAAMPAIGKAGGSLINTIKNNPAAAIGAGLGGPVGGALGSAVDAAGGIGKAYDSAKGAVKGAANTVKNWFESKIYQGFPRPIMERFCDIHFGSRFLTENANKIYNLGLTNNDITVMNEHLDGWITEQGLWDKIKSGAGQVANTALDYAVPDFIAGPEAVRGAIDQGIGKAKDLGGQAMDFINTQNSISRPERANPFKGGRIEKAINTVKDLGSQGIDAIGNYLGQATPEWASTGGGIGKARQVAKDIQRIGPPGGPRRSGEMGEQIAMPIGASLGLGIGGTSKPKPLYSMGELEDDEDMATESAPNSLTKRENMSPDAHKESIRDWTTNMTERLMGEQGLPDMTPEMMAQLQARSANQPSLEDLNNPVAPEVPNKMPTIPARPISPDMDRIPRNMPRELPVMPSNKGAAPVQNVGDNPFLNQKYGA